MHLSHRGQTRRHVTLACQGAYACQHILILLQGLNDPRNGGLCNLRFCRLRLSDGFVVLFVIRDIRESFVDIVKQLRTLQYQTLDVVAHSLPRPQANEVALFILRLGFDAAAQSELYVQNGAVSMTPSACREFSKCDAAKLMALIMSSIMSVSFWTSWPGSKSLLATLPAIGSCFGSRADFAFGLAFRFAFFAVLGPGLASALSFLRCQRCHVDRSSLAEFEYFRLCHLLQ